MIFSSFGNAPAQQTFTRMAKAVDELAKIIDEEVIVQKGNTQYDFHYAKTVTFLEHDALQKMLQEASIVILQGGWGTISEAIGLGKRIVSVPRRVGQECNHPQEEVVRHLEELGCLIGCYDEQKLPELVEKAKTFDPKPLQKGNAFGVINAFLKTF